MSRRKNEAMKRRIKRRLTEFLLRAVGGLLDHTIGPDDKHKRKKRKKQREAARDALDVSTRDGGPT